MGTFAERAALDVNKHVEKKNGLSYLSWAWAVNQLLTLDESATWEYREPAKFGDTIMVFCSVTAFGKTMTAQLPVMNHRNQAIQNPDSFAVNTAMQRCLAKAIALHGIGLYIYAGEDIPQQDEQPHHDDIVARFEACWTLDDVKSVWASLNAAQQKKYSTAKEDAKKRVGETK